MDRQGWAPGMMLLAAAAAVLMLAAWAKRASAQAGDGAGGQALKSITFNTQAYRLEPGQVEKRSLSIDADEEMHIVALEHFIGVGRGSWSDNGHILSTRPQNPWVEWEAAGTGMEPTGTTGYFGYCGRDYYTEVSGIQDVMAYEAFPAGTHVLVRRGETLHLHCYAHNFSPDSPGFFHHMVRVLYW